MKQLKRRGIFVLVFTLLLCLGVVIFCVRYVLQGRTWASSTINRSVYSSGNITSGAVYDRNGVLLYDCATQTYGETALLRTATLHLIGDLQGNIATGATKLFSSQLIGYNSITGISNTGNNVYLSIDSAVNETAYEALNGKSGVVAVYNYTTGEIVCLVSAPSFDPTNESQVAAVASGDSSYAGAYVNRFFSSTYTPGSTFKIITAAAALENLDTDSFSFTCTGSMNIGGDQITCTNAHGTLDFATALAKSCNCAFATLALELSGDTLYRYADMAGLLSSMTISGYATASGSYDIAEDGSVYLGWSGAGQYNDLINPATMLTLMGCIAGDGSAATPRLLSKVTTQSGLSTGTISVSTSSIAWTDATCEALQALLRNNVTVTYGQSQFGELAVCAKSGTAEVGNASPHAWFVGFIDDEEYPYAFVVVVENGGSGATVAGGIAAKVLNQLCCEG